MYMYKHTYIYTYIYIHIYIHIYAYIYTYTYIGLDIRVTGGSDTSNPGCTDQLNVIFDIIGTPTEQDLNYLVDENMKVSLRGLKPCTPKV
jgi:hypothetical protein